MVASHGGFRFELATSDGYKLIVRIDRSALFKGRLFEKLLFLNRLVSQRLVSMDPVVDLASKEAESPGFETGIRIVPWIRNRHSLDWL